MKFSFKKGLALMMTVVLLICAVPVNVFAVDPVVPEPPPLPWNVVVNTYEQMAMTDLQKLDADISGLTDLVKNMTAVSPIMQGISYIGTISGAFVGVYNMLKIVGIIEDPTQVALKNIMEALDELKTTVNDINVKVTNIQKQLNDEFSGTDFKLDGVAAAQHQKNWSDFRTGQFEEMSKLLEGYKTKMNNAALNWVKTWKTADKTDLRTLYNINGDLLFSGDNFKDSTRKMNPTPGVSDNAVKDNDPTTEVDFEIILPAEYIAVANKTVVDGNTYMSVMEKAMKEAVKKAVEDEAIVMDPSEFPAWKAEGIKTQEDVINKIADDMVNTILYEVTSSIANAEGSDIPYASQVLSAYKSFCAGINGTNTTNSSIHEILEYLKYACVFEGEARPYALEHFEMLGAAIAEYGAFTASLVAMCPGISSAEKTGLSELIQKTMETNNNEYAAFYKGYDNYCYPLKGVLSYVDVDTEYIVKAHRNTAAFSYSDWAIVDASIDFDTDNMEVYKYETKKNQALLKNTMLTARNIRYLCRYMELVGGDRDTMEYLKDCGVLTEDGEHSTNLLTSEFQVKSHKSDSKKLKPQSFLTYPKEFGGEALTRFKDGEYAIPYGGTLPLTLSEEASDKLIGTTYDIEGSTASQTSDREKTENPIGYRVLLAGFAQAVPNYVFYEKGNVTVTETDLPVPEGTLPQEINEYTAKMENRFGALVLNYNPERDPYGADLTINTAQQMADFLGEIANGKTYAGEYVRLGKDIDMKGFNLEDYWSSANRKNPFKGYFDGNGKTIRNVTIASSGHRVGLFRTTSGAVIKNLTLSGLNITATEEMEAYGGLIGYVNGSTIVDHVTISEDCTITGYRYVGGIIGETDEKGTVSVLNCKNDATITSTDTDAGGMLGNVGAYFLSGCENTGKITAKRGGAGGMCGYTNKQTTVKNCKNSGEIIGYDCAGGISGRIESDSRFSFVTGNENTGDITATQKGGAGGIVGWTDGGGRYADNKNKGAVLCTATEREHYAGGILGGNEDDPIILKGNFNEGKVKGNHHTGGIAGHLGAKDLDRVVMVLSNENTGTIDASTSNGVAGGIIGTIATDNKKHEVSFNTNGGEVTGVSRAGGIVGYMCGGGTFESNANNASILSKQHDAGGIVGGIEDDKCEFKKSRVNNPYVKTLESCSTDVPSGYDYVIISGNTAKHVGKICGWDGYRKGVVNSDTLFATIFGEGNIIIILSMLLLLIAAGVVLVVVFKKKKKEVKPEPET